MRHYLTTRDDHFQSAEGQRRFVEIVWSTSFATLTVAFGHPFVATLVSQYRPRLLHHVAGFPNSILPPKVFRRRKKVWNVSVKRYSDTENGFYGSSDVLRGPRVGEDALELEAIIAQGRPKWMWLDDLEQWTRLNTYKDIKRPVRIYVSGELALRHVNLLIQKSTADDDDDADTPAIFVLSSPCSIREWIRPAADWQIHLGRLLEQTDDAT